MPNTPEHKADMYRLARERQAAGLPVWDRKISVADVFHNQAMTFKQRRDAIVKRLRSSAWLAGRDESDELVLAVDELADAEDAGEFDGPWDLIYDLADQERVWISTF